MLYPSSLRGNFSGFAYLRGLLDAGLSLQPLGLGGRSVCADVLAAPLGHKSGHVRGSQLSRIPQSRQGLDARLLLQRYDL